MAVKQKINIFDTDTTTIAGAADDVYDVAFVPGFTNKFANATVSAGAPSSYYSETEIKTLGLGAVWYDTTNRVKYKLSAVGNSAKWTLAVVPPHHFSTSYEVTLSNCPDGVESVYTFAPYPEQTIAAESLPYAYGFSTHSDASFPYPSTQSLLSDGYEVTSYGDGTFMRLGAYMLKNNDDYAGSATGFAGINIANIPYDPNDLSILRCTTFGSVAYQITSSGASYFATMYRCVEPYVSAGYTYVVDEDDPYDYVADQSIRYDSYAAFVAENGTTPLCKWKYTVDTGDIQPQTIYSFLTVDDFVADQILKNSIYVTYLPISNVNIRKWKDDHLKDISLEWVDRNWIYAAELLRLGMPVFYCAFDNSAYVKNPGTFDGDKFFFQNGDSGNVKNNIKDVYAELADKGEYNIKYLTTGAFDVGFDATVQISTKEAEDQFKYVFYANGIDNMTRSWFGYMSDIVGYRKDCLALLDCTEDDCLEDLYPSNTDSVYSRFEEMVKDEEFVNQWNDEVYSSDDMARSGRRCESTFPWYVTNCSTFPAQLAQYRKNGRNFVMPGSFAYLKSLADAINKYESASWEAIAGVTRALIPDFVGLYVSQRLSNAVADAYNDRAKVGINAITNIRPYGYCIWGNRTLVNNEYFATLSGSDDGLVASSFVDIMSMVCNINKVAYRACKRLMFEKDNDKLWVRFLQAVSPYMDQLSTGGAVRTYEIQKVETTKRGHLAAKIIVWPYYAIDSVDVEIVLRDTEE